MTNPLFGSMPLMGKMLVERGLINEEQLSSVLTAQPKHNLRLGETAVSLGLVSDQDFAKFLADFLQLPFLTLDGEDELDGTACDLLSESIARRYGVIVTEKTDDCVTVAMVDPLDVRAIDAVRLETRCRVRKAVSSRSAITKAIDRLYHAPSRLAKSMDSLLAVQVIEDNISVSSDGPSAPLDHLKHEASDAPVIQFVNLLLMRAVQERASDIHIEPEETTVNIRLRVDGQLREMSAPPKTMLQGITTRIKLLANLDIAERRLPQDGRFKFTAYDKVIDVRLSCLPMLYGEKIVMRILDRSGLILDLEDLGFEQKALEVFVQTLHLPHGLVIVTGPTGSGKTTTLYAALNAIKSSTKNIVTLEDPVEYRLSKINQVNTRADIGFTFAAGLRSILRQDPDIVMLGEIRDRETAEICIRAALTGHLVLTTLHTNDAVSAVNRLTDMGIEPFLLAATLNLVMSQRLVRRICNNCSAHWEPPAELLKRLAATAGTDTSAWSFRRGTGCERCNGTGYHGRVAVYEPFLISENMKARIAEGASIGAIRDAAKAEGFRTLLQHALNKVQQGITTLDEALSVCATHSEMLK